MPNLFKNELEFFYFLLHKIDHLTLELNKNLFFSKINENIRIPAQNENNNTRVHFDQNSSQVTEEHDNANIFIEKIQSQKYRKIPTNLESFPLQWDSLYFREKLLEEFSNIKFDLKQNLSEKQLFFLKKFVTGKANFMILQCDKNVGSLIISKSDHDILMKENLEANNVTYKSLSDNPLKITIEKINSTLKNLYENKHISLKLFSCLKASLDSKLGTPRLLPKLHKAKFSTRLIINCIRHPTESLCSFVDQFLKEIVSKLSTVLKDSQDLLQRLNSIKSNSIKKLFLYSCDFESLYTNINPDDAINRICKYLKDNNLIKSKHFDLIGFKTFLKIIFKNNIFSFNGFYFLQLIGLPMGCKCGPTIANLYLFTIELDWVTKNSPLCYTRFIDDIMLASENELNTQNFENHFNYLKLNIQSGTEVSFLDLNISFDFFTNRFKTRLYSKPTNTFSYLIHNSNHPKHIFDNIPKSLFIRLRRICSSDLDYIFESKILIIQLVRRGYNYFKLKKIAINIGRKPRQNFINYKNKSKRIDNNKNEKQIYLFQVYDQSLTFFKRFILNAFLKTKYEFKRTLNYIEKITLKVFNSIGTNIGAYFIHGFKNKIKTSIFYNYKCDNPHCDTCKYLIKTSSIRIKNFLFPILSDSNCNSSGIIYIIACNKCQKYYIGETRRTAKKRFSEHLKNILDFKHNIFNSIRNLSRKSEIAIHFNCSKHSFCDLNYYILKNSLYNDEIRKSKETDLMHIFNTLKINILNRKIPDKKYIKHLFFS